MTTVEASGEAGGKRLECAAPLAAFTIVENRTGPLSKHLTLSHHGIHKTAAAVLVDGLATRTAVADLAQLAEIVEGLTSRQALVFGIAKQDRVRLATQKAIAAGLAPKGAICRDRKHFAWPAGRTVLMLDIDRPKDGTAPLRAREFDAMLCELLPWWSGTDRMYRPSASAFVYDSETGDELLGAGSLRCYAIADKGENIPFVGTAVQDALWRAGWGRVEFSASGGLLVRSAVDASVWQPERLDFAGPVVLGPGLSRAKHPPWIIPGADIDTELAIAAGPGRISPAAWQSRSLEVRKALHAARPESRRQRMAYAGERARSAPDPERARRQHLTALADGVLAPETPLHFADGHTATVAQVLESLASFDGKRCADPQDPDYAHDRRIAILYANDGWPRIFSHAHGGQTFKLGRAAP